MYHVETAVLCSAVATHRYFTDVAERLHHVSLVRQGYPQYLFFSFDDKRMKTTRNIGSRLRCLSFIVVENLVVLFLCFPLLFNAPKGTGGGGLSTR